MFLSKNIIMLIFVILTVAFLAVGTVLPEEVRLDNWYHYEQGLRMIDAKNWNQAQKEFTYYLNHPEIHRHMFGVAYFGRGLLFQAMGKYDQAITEFRLAIQNDLHPEISISDKAYMNVGNIYFKNKAYQDAVTAYSKAIEINPKNSLAHYYLGLSYLRVGEYDKAEKEEAAARKLGVPFTALKDELDKIKSSSSKDSEGQKSKTANQGSKTNKTTKSN